MKAFDIQENVRCDSISFRLLSQFYIILHIWDIYLMKLDCKYDQIKLELVSDGIRKVPFWLCVYES